MRLQFLLTSAIALVLLGGCASYVATQPAPNEPVGPAFSMSQLTLNNGGEKMLVVLRRTNDNGLLKVCGLYLLSGDAEKQQFVQSTLTDRNSNITWNGADNKKIQIHPNFVRGYLVAKDAPIANLPNLKDNAQGFMQNLRSANIQSRMAGCVTTDEPWQDFYNQATFKINLTKTIYTTTYIPVVYHR